MYFLYLLLKFNIIERKNLKKGDNAWSITFPNCHMNQSTPQLRKKKKKSVINWSQRRFCYCARYGVCEEVGVKCERRDSVD